MADYSEEAKNLYASLARSGIRLFKLCIQRFYGDSHLMMHGDRTEACFPPNRSHTFIHGSKTTDDWRRDVRGFLDSERNSLRPEEASDNHDRDDATLESRLYEYLLSLGYCDIEDVVSDVYEGAIALLDARIVDSPAHEEQENGFGHYGWEARGTENHH